MPSAWGLSRPCQGGAGRRLEALTSPAGPAIPGHGVSCRAAGCARELALLLITRERETLIPDPPQHVLPPPPCLLPLAPHCRALQTPACWSSAFLTTGRAETRLPKPPGELENNSFWEAPLAFRPCTRLLGFSRQSTACVSVGLSKAITPQGDAGKKQLTRSLLQAVAANRMSQTKRSFSQFYWASTGGQGRGR